MRIIAGTKRGMTLLSPKTSASRPITDRVKESLFSVLLHYDLPSDKFVADLFCGVGSLGLEALSRGAEFVTFVEQDPKVVAVLNRNIEKTGFIRESKVITANAFKIGAPTVSTEIRNQKSEVRCQKSSVLCLPSSVFRPLSSVRRYDLVFVDPPYALTRDVQAGSALSGLLGILDGQVAANGMVVVRTSRHSFLQQQYGRFQTVEQRQWGTTAVTILRSACDK